MIRCFEALSAPEPRLLILGSMPSVRSLELDQYYAHPRNQFWPVLSRLLKRPCPEDYAGRTELIRSHHLALWDVVGSCRRPGSLDSDIRDPLPNDIPGFLAAHPGIWGVALNGGKAFELYRRFFPELDLPVLRLPSTSPAYTLDVERKLVQWEAILPFLQE